MKKIFLKNICCVLASFFLLAHEKIMAQPFNLTESIQPVELNLAEYKKDGADKAKGRISMNTLSQDKDTMYYFVKGLSIYSPTYFSISSSDPKADIKVNLCKENWHTANKTGDVKGKGIWKTQFKTEGDFGIMVVANKKPTRYVLLAWTGEEMKIAMPSVFKTSNASDIKGGGWFRNNMLIVIISAVVLLSILFLVFKLKKKR
ncbi:MAG: hypothetical protein WCF67_18490 [Chitinophagaceae bacterium]